MKDDVAMTRAVASRLHTTICVRVWIIVLASACSSSKPSGESRALAVEASHTGIDLPGAANGLYWDAAERALYLTDDTHHQLLRWTDHEGFAQIATLATTKTELGGLVRLPDGTFVITSFGFGTDGAVFVVSPQHKVTMVPSLDRARRRIGIATSPDGSLYDTYFVAGNSQHHGGLARLDLEHGETDVATRPLAKPIGVAATQDAIYISDQEQGAIYAVRNGVTSALSSEIASPDLLTVLPDGELVTGSKSGALYRIGLDGHATKLPSTFEQVRGTAYDPTGKRLFVVEHSATTSNHKLHVLPLEL